jgi:protein-L-isoaspartate(D-aspartate) O-methyltransferase
MDQFQKQKKALIENLSANRYVKSEAVKKAMMKVKREQFVLSGYQSSAYQDIPLPIPPINEDSATISQPTVHAMMLEGLKLKKGDKVVEIGCGSGIVLAYMKEIVGKNGEVFGVEIQKPTYEFARENLKKSGYDKKVKLILGDGSVGLKDYAPFDKILLSAAAPSLPEPVRRQVKIRGIIVAVIGTSRFNQELIQFEKNDDETFSKRNLGSVIFVPLKGKYGMK